MKILILSFDSLRALLFSGFAMVETKVTALQTLAMINATTKTGFLIGLLHQLYPQAGGDVMMMP